MPAGVVTGLPCSSVCTGVVSVPGVTAVVSTGVVSVPGVTAVVSTAGVSVEGAVVVTLGSSMMIEPPVSVTLSVTSAPLAPVIWRNASLTQSTGYSPAGVPAGTSRVIVTTASPSLAV